MSNQQTAKPYPEDKVIIGFACAPLVGCVLVLLLGGLDASLDSISKVGLMNAINDFFYGIYSSGVKDFGSYFGDSLGFLSGFLLGLLEMVFVLIWVIVMGGAFALIGFGTPAVIFGLIYVKLKLERTPFSFIIISLVSFVGTFVVCIVYPKGSSFNLSGLDLLGGSGLAMVSSWIVGWFVLPKPEQLNQK